MFLTYLTLFVALCLSAVAAFYSIVGLAAIFAAAVMPIILMGSILEVAKLVVTVWLHEYWRQCKLTMKMYLVPAVGILMLITSMGIFGFLSKAHLDQAVPIGDVAAKLAIIDEKIKTSRENIDAARTALKQLDASVDQVLGRSTTEAGAERSVQIRRQQAPERQRLLREIEAEQKRIGALNEERAPIAAEVRKVEAEVGPIKYIAALIYGDNPDANLLEKAVRWVIIILVLVFDPLAVMMLLAATESMKWERERRQQENKQETEDATVPLDATATTDLDGQPPGNNELEPLDAGPEPRDEPVKPPVDQTPGPDYVFLDDDDGEIDLPTIQEKKVDPDTDDEDNLSDSDKENLRRAKHLWKLDNPGQTLKEQRRLLETGKIDALPWIDYLPAVINENGTRFGRILPDFGEKGDLFVLTSRQPTELYKHNGSDWIQVEKTSTDQYTYNGAYIDHLITKIANGEYDADLLTDSERDEIEERLKRKV